MKITEWMQDRLTMHGAQLAAVREAHLASWEEHVGKHPDSFVPKVHPATRLQIDGLRARIPELPPDYLAFVAACNGFGVEGFQSYTDYRVLAANEIVRLRDSDPRFISKWIAAHKSAGMHDSLGAARTPVSPHRFDANELHKAVVLAASRGRGEEAILWVPAPTAEYWRVASWEGCRRFSSMTAAVDHLLGEVVVGLDAAL